MKRIFWLLAIAAAGCINGAPLPPTPASSLAVKSGDVNADAQESAFVQMAHTYLRGEGKDPTRAAYAVHRSPRRDEDETADEPATAAVVDANFLDGSVWHLAVKTNGDITRLTNH